MLNPGLKIAENKLKKEGGINDLNFVGAENEVSPRRRKHDTARKRTDLAK